MKTSSKRLEGLETETQEVAEREFAGIHAEKPSSHLSKSENRIFSLEGKLTLLVTIAIALAAFLMTSCDPEPGPCGNCSGYTGNPNTNPGPVDLPHHIEIRALNPSVGPAGSTVSIVLDNFGESDAPSYVTFGSSTAQIVHARYGMIIARVPMDLLDGEYAVSVYANGQTASAPSKFTVLNSAY